MPIFEYRCTKCGNSFEILMREGTIPECPSCKSTNLVKKFSVFAAHTASNADMPACAGSCAGFSHGSCGSGMCGGD